MMYDLFEHEPGARRNLLPRDGNVDYFGRIFSSNSADQLIEKLLTGVEWRHDKANFFGKSITTKRKVAWYADQPYTYTYSGTTKTALAWTDLLLRINHRVAEVCNTSFNSCLLNLYHSGGEGMAWHADAEKDLKRNGVIALVSLGAERKFQFKNRETKDLITVWLEHGSLLVMKDTTQSYWLHRLPVMTNIMAARVSLTFRQIDIKL